MLGYQRRHSHLRDNFWVWIQVDGVVISPDPEVPPGLDVRDLHGVADGLDVGAGGACRQRRKFKSH